MSFLDAADCVQGGKCNMNPQNKTKKTKKINERTAMAKMLKEPFFFYFGNMLNKRAPNELQMQVKTIETELEKTVGQKIPQNPHKF